MSAHEAAADRVEAYPVRVDVRGATEDRNRLTTAFRVFLAIPHIILAGGPAAAVGLGWNMDSWNWHWSSSGSGLLGVVAACAAVFAWFAILFTARHPEGLWRLAAYYLRWRVRTLAYLMLLRDEYPPFGDDPYPAELVLPVPTAPRDRLTVAFRFFLALPHLFMLWLLGILWAFTTAVAWVMILFTGRYPETLYGFAIGVFAWSVRVEAYTLLLRDEYPPFSLRA